VTVSNYYETFNKPNVDIVNYQHTPFVEVTENGIRTTEKLHELDVIILATGFEVVDGSYAVIDIKGRNETLSQQWARDGVSSYLAIGDTGFPNLFFIVGPQSPLGNAPPVIEVQGTFINGLIAKAEKLKKETGGKPVIIEADAEAKKGWMDLCRQIANGSIFRNIKSYIFGNNGPRGDDNPGIFWLAGFANYRKALEDATEKDYAGFKISS
jgi:cyclohexanone monooxygenase